MSSAPGPTSIPKYLADLHRVIAMASGWCASLSLSESTDPPFSLTTMHFLSLR